MKSCNIKTILRIVVVSFFTFGFGVRRSYGQCVGDFVLPDPKANLPVFALQDFAGQATNGIIGGFIPELNFTPSGQINDYLSGLESLLSDVSICDIAAMQLEKPTEADMKEFWTSSPAQERIEHAQKAFDTNRADPNFGLNASRQIPNKGGASIPTVLANYVQTQLESAWDLLLINQFSEPVSLVWIDPEIQCKPKIQLPFPLGCATLPVCLPAGSSYNHVEKVYNVHRPGHHALVPDVLVTPMMKLIMALERGTSNWLPFVPVIMNKMDAHGFWGSRNPMNVNTMASSMFMIVQDVLTQKALQQNIVAQDKANLLMPFVGDGFAVTSMASVLASGTIPGFGTLPIPPFLPPHKSSALLGLIGLDVPFPLWPLVRTQYDEYHAYSFTSPDINPKEYLDARSMLPWQANLDSKKFPVLKNLFGLHASILPTAQSEALSRIANGNGKWAWSQLYENVGGGLMKDKNAPVEKKEKSWANPLSANGCVSFRGDGIFPETTFDNSTARFFCEIDQAINTESRECALGTGHCANARTSYWPNGKSPTEWGCSSEYSDIPDPETECRYDKFRLHTTHAAGLFNGSELPVNYYPKDENDLKEEQSPLASHWHRQRDCMDLNVARLFIPIICGWERCPSPKTGDLAHFEPAPNCVATSRYDTSITVPEEGCTVPANSGGGTIVDVPPDSGANGGGLPNPNGNIG